MFRSRITTQEINRLSQQLKEVFHDLDTQIVKIDERLSSAELDFMYGNITEQFYLERMKRLEEDIDKIKNKLIKIQQVGNNET
jgi:uncharacterized protein (UPF0335 family)